MNSGKLPKIALIADVENWAFHNISKQIVRYLSGDYDFKIFFYGQYEQIEELMFEVADFDLIHFFWRDALFSFLSPWVRNSFGEKNLDYTDFILNTVATANITTSASEHLLISETEAPERVILYNALAIGYTTFSNKLNKVLSSIPDYPQPFCNTEDGVDLDFFRPTDLRRFCIEKDEIVIGWVGNSKWGQGDGIDHKGFETIIVPTVEKLQAEGYPVRGHYADRHVEWIPHNRMNDYYNSIDIYVCASDIEGTPNPALEAMACGVPIVSTDVGIVSNVFGEQQKKYILPERSQEALRTKLIELIGNPQQRGFLSQENLESISHWSWQNQTRKWDEFFKAMLSMSQNPRIKQRRDQLRKCALENYLTNSLISENKTPEISTQDDTDVTESNREYEELKQIAEQLEQKINLMEQSRFWKVRGEWFKVKRKLGFAKDKY